MAFRRPDRFSFSVHRVESTLLVLMGCNGSTPKEPVPTAAAETGKKVNFGAATSAPAAAGKAKSEELSHEFKKSESVITSELETVLRTFFDKMDFDKDGTVTKEEAVKHWGKNFAKVNATAMFNEVDSDGDGAPAAPSSVCVRVRRGGPCSCPC